MTSTTYCPKTRTLTNTNGETTVVTAFIHYVGPVTLDTFTGTEGSVTLAESSFDVSRPINKIIRQRPPFHVAFGISGYCEIRYFTTLEDARDAFDTAVRHNGRIPRWL
jgi:hypothetical protein